MCRSEFQSTRPVWGATSLVLIVEIATSISIHAPRVGRDVSCADCNWTVRYFNPRAPCGARPQLRRENGRRWYFNPRAPCGARRSERLIFRNLPPAFQSTRPVWGATHGRNGSYRHNQHFNPRAPCGARHRGAARDARDVISIHAPRVGRDSKFDDFTPSNLHKRYKRVLARPKNTREKGKIKQKLAYIHAFSAFLGCEGSGTFCALVLRTQYR